MKTMKITNTELWNALRAKSETFKSITSKGTSDLFTERGFEALNSTNRKALDDFYGLSLTFVLNQINRPNLGNDVFEDGGFGESYENPMGAYLQRISVGMVKPVSPKYKDFQDREQASPFVNVLTKAEERFFQQNFDYQAILTIPDNHIYKPIFVAETGMFDFISAIQEQLENAYKIQKYTAKKETINAGINSTEHPLQDSQKVEVSLDLDNITEDSLKEFIITVNNIIESMKVSYISGNFNAAKYKSHQDSSRLKLLLRAGISSEMRAKLLASAFHKEDLGLDVDVITVEDFGGLVPKVGDDTVYPVYNDLGMVIGYSATEGATEATYTEDEINYYDPNKDVIAILADKGILFTAEQVPYQIETIRNPRVMATNFFANRPNGTVAWDYLYNCVVFKKASD